MIKKGSLIRRLAQDRRDKPEETTGGNGVTLAISMEGLLKDEKPAMTAEALAPATVPAPELEAPSPELEVSKTLPTLGLETAPVGQGGSPAPEAPAPAKAQAEKRTGAPHLSRVPGRQRRRHGDACVRHPGELKRNAGARAWLTPEESEKLELLATAYQISTSTLTREIILEGLEAHSELIEKTRRFLDSLGKGRVGA
jgi:hypothetical protein